MITGVQEPSLYKTACQAERCDPTCVRYTRDQLLAISPARLTSAVFVYHANALAVVVRI